MALENSQLIRRWFDQVWNQGRAEVIDQMSHPQTKGYGQAEHGRQIDMDEFKKLWSGSAFRVSGYPCHHSRHHRARREGGGPLDCDHDPQWRISRIRTNRPHSHHHRHQLAALGEWENHGRLGQLGSTRPFGATWSSATQKIRFVTWNNVERRVQHFL